MKNTITINKTSKYDEDFDGIYWVLLARSGDELRPNLQGCWYDGGMLISCDGHRAHCYMTERGVFEDKSNYKVVIIKKDLIVLEKIDLDYPDISRVFPVKTHNGIEPLRVPSYKHGATSFETEIVNHIVPYAENRFQIEYLFAACRCGEGELLNFRQAGKNIPLTIVNDDYTKAAVIMPLRS